MYGYGFLSRGFTDRREILHGGSAWSRTGLLLFGGGIARGMAELWASTGRHMAVYASCWSTRCFYRKNLFKLIFILRFAGRLSSQSATLAVNCCEQSPVLSVTNNHWSHSHLSLAQAHLLGVCQSLAVVVLVSVREFEDQKTNKPSAVCDTTETLGYQTLIIGWSSTQSKSNSNSIILCNFFVLFVVLVFYSQYSRDAVYISPAFIAVSFFSIAGALFMRCLVWGRNYNVGEQVSTYRVYFSPAQPTGR